MDKADWMYVHRVMYDHYETMRSRVIGVSAAVKSELEAERNRVMEGIDSMITAAKGGDHDAG